MGRTIYFTTPIYYVNAEPHIGHLFTTVLADVLKRFHKMIGDDAYFLTGTDEHGEKIAQTAEKQGIEVTALVNGVSDIFQNTWKEIGIENDDFIRTTEPRHKKFVSEILQKVYDNGDIYFDEYAGLYCVGCERYFTQTELVDGKCPDHQVEPKEVKEANYFFRMGKYKEALVAHIKENPDWIRPERYRNEVLSFLEGKLEDLCISRPKTRLTWGIDLPFDNRFVTYVWFDALLNYASALKTTSSGRNLFDRYWPGCNHLIAKDILKTHAVYWPTMLMSAKIHPQNPLFDRIDVHGYWLSGDSKMSKSLGNVVRPLEFQRQFGIENLRYFFFREMKFGNDANFTYELFVERYNADLANGLGNLLSRTAAMVKKSLGGAVPKKTLPGSSQPAAQAEELVNSYKRGFESRDFHKVVSDIRSLLQSTDVYINESEPWKLAKQPGKEDELMQVLYTGLEVVRIVSILLSPIMPKSCAAILGYLGEERPLDGTTRFEELCAWGGLRSGHPLADPPKAFPRIDNDRLSAVIKEAKTQGADKGAIAGSSARRTDMQPIKPEISIDDFAKVDLRVGVVKEASLVAGADKLIRLMVDLGEEKPRQVFAGVRSAYPEPEKLVGTKVIVVANLKPRQMKFGLSEGMILAASGSEDRLCAATFDGALPLPGDKVS